MRFPPKLLTTRNQFNCFFVSCSFFSFFLSFFFFFFSSFTATNTTTSITTTAAAIYSSSVVSPSYSYFALKCVSLLSESPSLTHDGVTGTQPLFIIKDLYIAHCT